MDTRGVGRRFDRTACRRRPGAARRRRRERATPVTGVSEFPNLDEPALSAAASTATDLPGAAPNLARVARHFEALRDRADAVAAAGRGPRHC